MIQPFSDIIGQDKIKRKLQFHLNNYNNTKIFPVTMLLGAKGEGKTFLAKSICRNLLDSNGDKKPLIELNCAAIPRGKKFFEEVWADHIQFKEVNIIFDECHLMDKELATCFLSLFNITNENKNILKLETCDIEADFTQQTFILASSEPQMVLETLIDRCEVLTFEPYQNEDLMYIILSGSKCEFEEGILQDAVSRLRGNPRAAQKLSKNIGLFVKSRGINKITQDNWSELKKNLDLSCEGLNNLEIKVLKTLKEFGPQTLTKLAAKISMSKAAVQNRVELYLHKQRMIEISERGREITKNGRDVLEKIDKEAKNL